MHPVIRVIPTFGTYRGCYHAWAGYKPASAENIPVSWMARMIWTGRITPVTGVPGC